MAIELLLFTFVLSVDSLGVEISLGLINKSIVLYSVVVGIGAFFATYLGLFLAKKLSGRFGKKVEFIGGAVLIALGIKMLSI